MYMGLDKIGLRFWKTSGADRGDGLGKPYEKEELQSISTLNKNTAALIRPQTFVQNVSNADKAERSGDFGVNKYTAICKAARAASAITDISTVQVYLTDGKRVAVLATYQKGNEVGCVNKNPKDLPAFVAKADGLKDALKYMYTAMKEEIKQNKGIKLNTSDSADEAVSTETSEGSTSENESSIEQSENTANTSEDTVDNSQTVDNKPSKPKERAIKDIVSRLHDGLNLIYSGKEGRPTLSTKMKETDDSLAKAYAKGRSSNGNTITVLLRKEGEQITKVARYVGGQEVFGEKEFNKDKVLESLGF